MDTSPFLLIKALEVQIKGILRNFDLFGEGKEYRRTIKELKQTMADARLDARDYELSETRSEQLEKATDAKKRLGQLRTYILTASEYNIFSAVDVAQLTAQLEEILSRLI